MAMLLLLHEAPKDEPAHKTLQDRLVKELRLAGAWLHGWRERPPPGVHGRLQRALCQGAADKKDLHRPLHARDDLEDAFPGRRSAPSRRR
jgi:hypothetical protein